MIAPLFMTWEEYLAFEEQSPCRHEYVNGTVCAMDGASLAHNCIAQARVEFRSIGLEMSLAQIYEGTLGQER
jgi:hypothetical protein